MKIEDNTAQVLRKLGQTKEGGPHGEMLMVVLLRCVHTEHVMK